MKTLSAVHIPKRKDDTHKGDYGRILLIGGNANLGGAIMLASTRLCIQRKWLNYSRNASNKSCRITFSLS